MEHEAQQWAMQVWRMRTLQGAHSFKARSEKLDSQWELGLWLGKDSFNNEAILSIVDGTVTKTRSIRRLPPSQHYQQHMLDSLRVAPWDLDHYLVVRQTNTEPPQLLDVRRVDVAQDAPRPQLEDRERPVDGAPPWKALRGQRTQAEAPVPD